MGRILLYTFRTFPDLSYIESLNQKYFVFDKLKESFEIFKSLVDKDASEIIIGIAATRRRYSFIELRAINKFNRTKTINKKGKEYYDLYIPDNFPKEFNRNSKTYHTFCNWSAYKIREFLEKKDTKIMFCHIAKKDAEVFKMWIKSFKA